jgi:sugar phosphate isomerase/epimerase
MNRRSFLRSTSLALAAGSSAAFAREAGSWRFRYLLASSMYGDLRLEEILPEVAKTGAGHIDLWPRPHGTQRGQAGEMGDEAFAGLLGRHGVKLGCSTRFDLGPFRLRDEMRFVSKLGGDLLVCAGQGPKGLKAAALKMAVKKFAEQLKPHAEALADNKVRLAIENHGSNLIDTPDSLKWLAEMTGDSIGVALAPYHLETHDMGSKEIAALIEALGDRILLFYAWQHGKGCRSVMPKEDELLQMPGRGELDFGPIVASLRKIDFRGYASIFMHPTPRGIPILPTIARTTAEIARARACLEAL